MQTGPAMGDEPPQKRRGTPKRELARRAVDADAHARAPAKAERVRLIAEMMALGEWWGSASHYALAEKWGLSVHTIASDANEAGRTLEPTTAAARNALRIASAHRVIRLAKQAATERSVVTGLADISGAVKAEDFALRCFGVDIRSPEPEAAQPIALRVVVVEEPEPQPPDEADAAPDDEPAK